MFISLSTNSNSIPLDCSQEPKENTKKTNHQHQIHHLEKKKPPTYHRHDMEANNFVQGEEANKSVSMKNHPMIPPLAKMKHLYPTHVHRVVNNFVQVVASNFITIMILKVKKKKNPLPLCILNVEVENLCME